MAIQARTDRRFRRVRVTPPRRRRAVGVRRTMGAAVVLTGISVSAALAPGALRHASFLNVDAIDVLGTDRVSEGEVLALVGGLRGANILTVDLESYRDRLLTSGWIAEATLRRVLPSTIAVTVRERQPVGFARFGRRLYLIDEEATVIAEHGPGLGDDDLPIVDGLVSGRGAAIDERRAALASALLAELQVDRELSRRVSQIGVGDPYDAVVLLNDSPTLIHLGHERFVARLRRYLELAPTLRDYIPEIDYVDMRFEKRVVVREAEAGTAPGPLVAVRKAGARRILTIQ